MKQERVMLGGAIAAAFAASLCCIAPLVFVLLGVGAFGAATMFETARPYLLGAAVLFLAFGFYRAYFRREKACAPDGTCTVNPMSGASRVGLWFASAAVLAFALSPYYAGALARRITTPAGQAAQTQGAQQPAEAQARFKVTGMTCAGCEATIKLALEQSAGVRKAEVSYERGDAVATYDPNTTTPDKLCKSINETGYKCELPK